MFFHIKGVFLAQSQLEELSDLGHAHTSWYVSKNKILESKTHFT